MSFPAQPSQARSRRPLIIALLVAASVVVALAGAAGAYIALRPSPSSAGTASPTGLPSPVELDERGACVQLVALLNQAADVVLGYTQTHQVDPAKAGDLGTRLTTLYKVAPASMRDDIATQASTMSSVATGNGYDRDSFVNSGTRLANSCRRFATG